MSGNTLERLYMIHALRSQSFKNELLQDIANMPTNELQETLQHSIFLCIPWGSVFMTPYYHYSVEHSDESAMILHCLMMSNNFFVCPIVAVDLLICLFHAR